MGFRTQDIITTLSSEQRQHRGNCQVNEEDHCIILGKPVSECQQYVPGATTVQEHTIMQGWRVPCTEAFW